MNWFMVFVAFILGSGVGLVLACCILSGKISDMEMGLMDIGQSSIKTDDPETVEEKEE